MQIASRVGENGSVTCIDRDARKIAALQHRFAEFPQLLTPAFVLGDATDPALLPQTLTFDRVLVDAPCTALGVLARHPEARWWRKHDDAARLAPTQRALLEAMASHVAPGGRLLYAVCSNDEREGSEVVEAFLASSNFVRVPMPERLAAMCDAKGDVLIPPIDGRDGFFISAMERPR